MTFYDVENLSEEVKKIIYKEIPNILEKHPEVKLILWKKLVDSFADKKESESKFDTLLRELKELKQESDRKWRELKQESEIKWKELKEESDRKWKELKEESDRKWRELKEESDRRWEEFQRKWKELKEESESRWRELKQESDQRWETLLKELRNVNKRIDRTIGALGARWGLNTERAFRQAIKSILEELTDLKVENYPGYDEKGEVFGHPDQIELDVVLKNGEVWVIEIKSSMSKADMYIFDRKVKFYEKKEGKKVNRKMVISPMIEEKAYEVARRLGIEAYKEPEDLME
ncbi:DUF3782 domain-containing protein [Desulfothermus naphthae]